MKKIFYINIYILLIFVDNILLYSNRVKVDKIIAIVYSGDEKSIILQSDLKPGLDGIKKNLEQLINDRLVLLDAKKLKIEVDKEQVNRYLSQVQRQYNLTQNDIKKIFSEAGYTYDEGIENLKNIQTIDLMLETRVRSKIIIDKKEIEDYYNKNPLYEVGKYYISQAFIPFNGGSKTLKKIKVQKDIESKDILKNVEWSDPIEFEDKDFSDDKKYIANLNKDDVVISNEDDRGLYLIRIVDKKEKILIPLENRYKEISSIIGKERYEKALNDYYNMLRKSAIIKYQY